MKAKIHTKYISVKNGNMTSHEYFRNYFT